jgi:PAS domain S-box-containing protein
MTDRSAVPALYREAFAASTDASLITDAAFRVVDATDACLDMLGRERETLLGDTPEPLFADPGVFATATERVSAGGTWRQECELRTAGGEALRVEGSATPLTVDGEHRGAVFGFADLTERYNRQESLRVLNRVLRHNLRNDANVVLGHLQDAGNIATDERVEESIDVARGRMERSLDRARTAREFSRHLTGDEETTLYPVDLGGALEQAINKVDTAGATVRADVPSGLLVRADETLTAALRNVVENAVEHTGANPTVGIDAATDEETATLRVADDGPGIPPERRDKVRERGGTAVRHGQGLGLFFVDRLLAAYGGDLRIADSELGGCLVALEFDRASAEGLEFSEDW